MNFKKLRPFSFLMLLMIIISSCSKGDDNVVDPGTIPTTKLPTLKLSTNTNNAFVGENITFTVSDDKGNVIEDVRLFINDQPLATKTFSSKTAATFKVYAQKAGYKTSNSIDIRFIEKDAVNVVVTGKWKFVPFSIESIFEFKEDMSFTFKQGDKMTKGKYLVQGNRVQMIAIDGDLRDEDYGVINISDYTPNLLQVEVIAKGIFQKGQKGQLERFKDNGGDNGNGDGDGDGSGDGDGDGNGTIINLNMFYGEWRGYEENSSEYSLKMKFKGDKMEAEAKNMGKYNPVFLMLDDMRYYSLHDSSTLIMTGKKTNIVYYFRVSNYSTNEINGTLYFGSITSANSTKITLRRK